MKTLLHDHQLIPRHGATREEITEALGGAIAIDAGAAQTYSA